MQHYTRVAAQPAGRHSQDSADIVIVGNGIAGLSAAVEARRLAPDLRIAIITKQSHPTINTPALKQFAIGKLQREQLLAYPVGTERAQRIQLIQGQVVEIHAQGKYVGLANGCAIGYGSLLLATGSVAVGLPAHLPGRDFDGVMTLHRLHDYMNLRRRLCEVEEAVVIGSGAHAIETVTSLLYLGTRARVYSETEPVGIVGNIGAVAGVVTNHQQMLPCQLVLVCTGKKPVTTLAEHCTLPMMYEDKQGIVVNNLLRTNVPGIYAAGDVAALQNPQTGVYETRAQWYAGVVQGYTAAATMTGQPPTAIQSFGVPWHATLLGERSLLTVGSPMLRIPGSVTLTDIYKGTYHRLSMLDNRLLGYLSLGHTQADGLAIKRLIDEGLPIAPVKEALLSGTFDARRYFSQRRSISVQATSTPGTPATPGKQPVVRTAQQLDRPLSIVGSIPVTPLHRPAVSAQFRVIHASSEKDSVS